MSERDENRFRIRPGPPKNRQPRFVSRVLQQVSKAGGQSGGASSRPRGRLGRGHVAARFAGDSSSPGSRRVVIKARIVNLKQAGARATATHLRYIERDGIGRQGEAGQAYGPRNDEVNLPAFEACGGEDRHQFRFIVAPEDAAEIEDLRRYTRNLMQRMEADLGTHLEWVAVDHWDTDNPHTHVVLRGKDGTGRDLVIAGNYMAHGMRQRAAEVATEWLGPRTEIEIRQGLVREVNQERLTGLDRALLRHATAGVVDLTEWPGDGQRQPLLRARLQRLDTMGLAKRTDAHHWRLSPRLEPTLTALGERGDILRNMQKALHGQPREFVLPDTQPTLPVIGRIAGKGLADEMNDRGYLVVDGVDGRAHYVVLNAGADLGQFPVGGIVAVRSTVGVRAGDQTLARLARDGLYRVEEHLMTLRKNATSRDPDDVVTAHVRRLEALRRAGVVERVADGVWRVPDDLAERGRQYDMHQTGGATVELQSHLPIERQVRAIGATWLDRQLIGDPRHLAASGFGGEVRDALLRRADFLVEEGLAQRRGQRVILMRDLLATLRGRDVDVAAKAIAAETGLTHHPAVDGERVNGVYRRSVLLASGRFAMLDGGMSFSLVPWRPAIEERLGHQMTAVVRRGEVSWTFRRMRGPAID